MKLINQLSIALFGLAALSSPSNASASASGSGSASVDSVSVESPESPESIESVSLSDSISVDSPEEPPIGTPAPTTPGFPGDALLGLQISQCPCLAEIGDDDPSEALGEFIDECLGGGGFQCSSTTDGAAMTSALGCQEQTVTLDASSSTCTIEEEGETDLFTLNPLQSMICAMAFENLPIRLDCSISIINVPTASPSPAPTEMPTPNPAAAIVTPPPSMEPTMEPTIV